MERLNISLHNVSSYSFSCYLLPHLLLPPALDAMALSFNLKHKLFMKFYAIKHLHSASPVPSAKERDIISPNILESMEFISSF
jgi:hypothetical protein